MRLPGVVGLVIGGLLVGEEGLGLIERTGSVEVIGGVGLLYLMFLAGLELDLEVLERHRRSAVGFGLLTFAVPISVGTAVAVLLGYGTAASILIGSLWASHTLVAYPIIRRHGLAGDPAVAAAVGATVITDTLALLVLAVVAGSVDSGGLGARFFVGLIPGLVILVAATTWLMPRLAAWFFRGLGQERLLRFLFVFTAFLAGALLAEAVGIEGIVGAFLTGLALNRLVPNGGVLMQRVEFVGSALLIPIFLVSVGMLIDLRVVADVETLGLAGAFSVVALGTKWLAAWAAARLFRFDPSRRSVMFALSGAQAAATLAATIVAFDLGLFGEQVVNAVLMVVLVTVVVTSWTANRSAPRVERDGGVPARLGRAVIVPVANPEAAPNLIRLAVRVARADGGHVVPLHVVTSPGSEEVSKGRQLMAEVEAMVRRLGAEVDGIVRVDTSVASAVVHTVAESDGSLVLVGWKVESKARDRLLGTILDDMVGHAQAPVAAAWLPRPEFDRVLLDLGDLGGGSPDAVVATGLAVALAKASAPGLVKAAENVAIPAGWMATAAPWDALLRPGDLLVAAGSLRAATVRQLIGDHPDVGIVVVTSAARTGVAEVQDLFRAR